MNSLSNYIKRIIQTTEHRLLEKELILNINPISIEYYSIPFNDNIRKFTRSKDPFSKLYYYVKHHKTPIVIPESLEVKIDLFHNDKRFQFMDELWKNNLDYKKTRRYSEFIYSISNGKTVFKKNKYRLSSEKDLNLYFRDYQNLLISMNEQGYLSDIEQDELLIWIGPDGQPVKDLGGRHRLAAAQVTCTSHVPVRIIHIHEKWIKAQSNNSSDFQKVYPIDFLRHIIELFKAKYSINPIIYV